MRPIRPITLLLALSLTGSAAATGLPDGPTADCRDRPEVIAIDPYSGLVPSRSLGGGPLYAVKYRKCGQLLQVLIEAKDNTGPAGPLSLQPMVF